MNTSAVFSQSHFFYLTVSYQYGHNFVMQPGVSFAWVSLSWINWALLRLENPGIQFITWEPFVWVKTREFNRLAARTAGAPLACRPQTTCSPAPPYVDLPCGISPLDYLYYGPPGQRAAYQVYLRVDYIESACDGKQSARRCGYGSGSWKLKHQKLPGDH